MRPRTRARTALTTHDKPYVRFVLASSDPEDGKGERMVIDIKDCGEWAKEGKLNYNMGKTFNKGRGEGEADKVRTLRLYKENANSGGSKWPLKACQTFLLGYYPDNHYGFTKAFVKSGMDSKLNVGWHSHENGVPTWVEPVDPFDLPYQQVFGFDCRDGWNHKKATGGKTYYGKRCLIKMGKGDGHCLGYLTNDDKLGTGICPGDTGEIDPTYEWNLEAVGGEIQPDK